MRRMVLGAGDGDGLAPAVHDALHRLAIADRALMEALRHLTVGTDAAEADRFSELGNVGDPEADGERRHLEELGVGGPELAVVAGEFGIVRSIPGRMADDTHGRYMVWHMTIVK